MTPFAIAGIQQYVSAVHDNIPRMKQRLDVVMHLFPWVQMVMWSELAPYGPFTERAQTLPGPADDIFREMARKHEIWLLPGSMYEKGENGEIYNTSTVYSPDGEIVGRYRKMFPFLPYEQGVTPGEDFLAFDIPNVGRFGVSICYDMWFPETTRQLVSMGVEVLLHPSLTPTIDRRIELAIAQATAAMNQCFVIDVNGIGDGGNGRSTFCSPAGEALYTAGTSEEVVPLEIDLNRVRRSREIGLRGLGQPLKSFRDSGVQYPVYDSERRHEFLKTLGPLKKPERGSRAGLPGHNPMPVAPEMDPPPAETDGMPDRMDDVAVQAFTMDERLHELARQRARDEQAGTEQAGTQQTGTEPKPGTDEP